MMLHSLFLIGAYLVGAIPTAFIVARFKGITDITRVGSGNSGATNVGRMIGGCYFLLVLLIDLVKAYFYLTLLNALGLSSSMILASSLLLMIGNSVSIFLKGKGGKGVATAIGIVLYFNPMIAFCAFLVWVLIVGYTKNIGISSIAGLLSLPFITSFYTSDVSMLLLMIFIAVWGTLRHSKNIVQYFNLPYKYIVW